jgi:hypothetical protein
MTNKRSWAEEKFLRRLRNFASLRFWKFQEEKLTVTYQDGCHYMGKKYSGG